MSWIKNAFTVLLCFLILLITSCSNRTIDDSSKTKAFESLYSDCSMNSEIVFTPLQPNYKTEDFIIVNYHNVSTSEIAFPPGDGLRIYVYSIENNTWIEIKNNMSYSTSPGPYHYLSNSNDLSSYGGIMFTPEFSGDKPAEIRIAITGYIYRDNVVTDKCVGAFLDLAP